MSIYLFRGEAPQIAATAWVADNARVIGRVALGAEASVWFGAVLRGDIEPIEVGEGSNVQDGAVIHTDQGFAVTVGDNVTVGHQATLHGCTVGDGSLIGIQAVVLNGAKIGQQSLVGAGALVTEGKEFPDESLIVGCPAKLIRRLTPEEVEGLKLNAARYVESAKSFRDSLTQIA